MGFSRIYARRHQSEQHRNRPKGPCDGARTKAQRGRAILAFLFLCVGLGAVPVNAQTLTNCGFPVEVTRTPPQRVVTIKSTATEMLLALDLGDRIVGQAFQDGPPPPDWAKAYAAIPVLAEKLPSAEAVLALSPDLIYAGWESNFSAEGLGERALLADLGIASYVSPAACRAGALRPPKLTFAAVFAQIAEIGAIFGVPERADALIRAQREALAALPVLHGARTAVWYSSGIDTPYVGAGIGAPQMMLEALGLTNIAADVADSWTSLSWEAVIAADPDVIVLVDAAWNTAAAKAGRLAANPATATMRAVRERRFLVIPFVASEAGVRNVPAVLNLARQLAELPQ